MGLEGLSLVLDFNYLKSVCGSSDGSDKTAQKMPSSETRRLTIGLQLPPISVNVSSEGSGETAHLCSLS